MNKTIKNIKDLKDYMKENNTNEADMGFSVPHYHSGVVTVNLDDLEHYADDTLVEDMMEDLDDSNPLDNLEDTFSCAGSYSFTGVYIERS